MHFLPVDLPARRDEQEEVVRGGDEEVLDEVALFVIHAQHPDAAAALQTVGGHRQSLHVPRGCDRYDHLLHGDHVFDVYLVLRRQDLSAAVVPIHLPDLEKLVFDHAEYLVLVGQESFQIAGDVEERGKEKFIDEDVKMVMEKAGVSEAEAKKALDEEGDIASAILKLKS